MHALQEEHLPFNNSIDELYFPNFFLLAFSRTESSVTARRLKFICLRLLESRSSSDLTIQN